MTDRPITLHPFELAAALAGTLTQVRRPVVPQPHEYATLQYAVQHPARGPSVCGFACVDDAGVHMHDVTCRCPFGQPGDVIWGKHTWWQEHRSDYPNAAFDDGTIIENYPGTLQLHLIPPTWRPGPPHWKKRSASSMPRWASRWARTVAAVRVERIQDMTPEDAEAWGVQSTCRGHLRADAWCLWDSLYQKKFPWTSNPWQWVADLDSKGE